MDYFLSVEKDFLIIQEFSCISPQYVMGTDEAGRGPLAGPLVVAGVVFDCAVDIPQIYDSKKLTEKTRLFLNQKIKDQALAYHIEVVDLELIEKLNIYQASKWGMICCWKEIQKKINLDAVLTDAMKISSEEIPSIPVISLIKGDQKSFHIAAASILAKVKRDEIMLELHNTYPYYFWDKNKGYPTKQHRSALQEFGASPHHRKGFRLFSG